MSMIKVKQQRRQRRKMRVRRRVFGTAERPRLTIFRSLKNIYAQMIDDETGRTLVEASSVSKELAGVVKYGGNVAAAAQVGDLLAQRALAKGVKQVTMDRNGYRFHGRVKAVAEAVRKAGIKI
ncbi:MAG TPA: 50S ribosomal protein L18 [Phycisphaerae bacterium]|nr:50S ribosomal protein L18 [Phycisphaerae bacterium]HRR87625.1 50S ribosomal protein L18 [Phycisphaerae bacterium]